MKRTLATFLATTFLLGTIAPALADRDDHRWRDRDWRRDHHRFEERHEWRRGDRFDRDDWRRGRDVDWRFYHLHAPGRGYRWCEIDGRFVLVAVATGVIIEILEHNR
jgi:Ni/Co efflux regulator RcnB